MKEDLKKLTYALLRCPVELLDLLKCSADKYKWEHGGGIKYFKNFISVFFDSNLYIYILYILYRVYNF